MIIIYIKKYYYIGVQAVHIIIIIEIKKENKSEKVNSSICFYVLTELNTFS